MRRPATTASSTPRTRRRWRRRSSRPSLKSFEFGDHTPIGVFYQNEFIPTYEERLTARMPSYKTNPPADQEIAHADGTPLANIDKLLEDMRV